MNAIPRIRFAHLPTAIEEMPRLSAALGGPNLLIKRDDQTGLAFGGNKTRKLEFLVAEAQQQGACLLITGGAMQSNHCRQTAAAAARFGMECILVLTGEHQEQPTGNLLLDFLFDADVVWVSKREERDAKLQEIYHTAQESGCKPYLVPYGGSSPTGALGYAFAIEEMLTQGVRPDWVVFGSSSGGTHAGLVLGQRVFGYEGKILGISIDEPAERLKAHVAALASAASEKLGARLEISPHDVLAEDRYCQAGYGVFGEAEREAITLFAHYEGILLDPVYTGRAAAGLIDLIRQGFFRKDETVLFWHTGGQPALFAAQYQDAILE
ncbi:MAG: D-cysteine desulfhydrase family protein [Anaerolineales bacterium]|nr:D-cysteine desulfhydrase family protein [Anaerolineales bacterium]MCX7754814.1 D-cysteine desulfhydrase family protein [Anaerolineales bacterium]MDW8277812.1 D-cysteine desulfhydrase family protein [Anaerolineales bacterium]